MRNNSAYIKSWQDEIKENPNALFTAIAKAFAESEFEQYRVLQDKSYENDFDRLVAESLDNKPDEE